MGFIRTGYTGRPLGDGVQQTGSMERPYLRNTSPLRELFHKRKLPVWPPFSVTSAPAGGSRRGVPLTGVGKLSNSYKNT